MGPALCCRSLPVQPSPVFLLHLSPLPCTCCAACLGKEARQKPQAGEQPLAVHRSPQCQMSDVRWLCLPGSVDLLLVPTVLLALLFLSSHCFLILSHCAPSTFFQVHFCIYFGQGSISRGFTFPCNRQPPAQLGTQGIGWKGSRMPGVSLLCTQTLSFHRTEVLYVGCFFFVVIQWLIKIAPTYLVLTVYQEVYVIV